MTRLGVVADVHLGYGDDEAVRSDLRAAVDRLADRGVDRLVVVGDLLQESSPAADVDRIGTVRTALEAPGLPVTYVRGNHDVVNLSDGALTALLEEHPYGVGRTDGEGILHLNSAAPALGGARGEVGADGRAFLEWTLAREAVSVCFVHHPVCLPDLSENPWFAGYPERAVCGDRKGVADTLRQGGVDLVVSGHVHESHHLEDGGVEHLVLGPFNRATPAGGRPATHAELLVREDDIAVTEWAGEEVQRRVTVTRRGSA